MAQLPRWELGHRCRISARIIRVWTAPMADWRSESLELVVKISKYCNLRCTYCYEFAELGQKKAMSLDQLRTLMITVKDLATIRQLKRVNFHWHGGEPFMIPLARWNEIADLADEIFPSSALPFEVTHSVQTNLTILTDRHLEFLKTRRLFQSVGVSFDVVGGRRVDLKGHDSNATVATNVATLMETDVDFGFLAVLSKQTLPHIESIYAAFDKLGVVVRFLPFYVSAFDEQIPVHEVTGPEIAQAYKRVFDAWLQSPTATEAVPVDELTSYAVRYLTDTPLRSFDGVQDESVFVINTDGEVYPTSFSTVNEGSYGNVFRQSFEDIIASKTRHATNAESAALVQRYCGSCKYKGSCPGFIVSSATRQERAILEKTGCYTKDVIDHIVERILEHDLIDDMPKPVNASWAAAAVR
jgi:uncharacterized protein